MKVTVRFTTPADQAPRHGVLDIDGLEWFTVIPPEAGDLRAFYDAWLRDGDGVEIPAPPPQSATKLGLKRAMEELGRWGEVRDMIGSSPDIAEDWALATEIRRDDVMFTQFIAAGSFTDAEVDEVFRRAVEIVA